MTALKYGVSRRRSGLMQLIPEQVPHEGRWSGFLLCLREGEWAYSSPQH
jgi:hypothetical protein